MKSSGAKQMLISVAGVAAVIYLALSLLMFVSQDSLLYLPDIPERNIVQTPSYYQMPYDDVRLSTPDGETLHGWFVPAENPVGKTVVIFHGNAGNISHRLDTLRIWHALGYDSFIFDYRGYGESTGNPSEEGTRTDALTAWAYLTKERNIPTQDIVIFGRSMGGAVASRLATEVSPAALIVESSFTSVPDIADELYPWLPVRMLSRFDYATRDYVAMATCPVMVIHSSEDEIIPFHHGKAIYKAAATPKYMLTLKGDHNRGFIDSGTFYIEGLRDFLATVFEGE